MKKILFFIAFCLAFSIGCATLTGSIPDMTPTIPSEIQETAEITSVPDDIAKMLDGEPVRLFVVAQKFSFEASSFLYYEEEDNSVYISNEAEDFLIAFIVDENTAGTPLSEIPGQYLASVKKDDPGYVQQQLSEINVAGRSGVRLNFETTQPEGSLQGSVVAIQSDEGWVMVAIGMANTTKNENMWAEQGLSYFEQMLTSVKFLDTDAECPVSTDETYGYTPENPIKVGGDIFGGASRERVYLDHLLDANGGRITYERSGSNDFGDVILDIYVVTTSAGDQVSLYLDMYNYTSPQAPVGFTCQGAFPLSAP